jgi:Flp pilus assembly protein TadG
MRMRNRFVTGCRGQSTIEFAFTLPLLLLLALGVFEFGRAIQAKNIITNMSREGTNLTSRSTTDPKDIMTALADTAQPLDMQSYGIMYITKMTGLSDGRIKVVEQYRWPSGRGTPPSKVATCGSWSSGTCTPSPSSVLEVTYATLHLNINDLADGQVAYATEVFYNYPVIFRNIIKYSPQIYSITVF